MSDSITSESKKKVEELKKLGINPYPYVFSRTHKTEEVKNNFEALEKSGETVAVCGKIIAKREHGGSVFFDLADIFGRLQIYVKKDEVGEKLWELMELLDTGDFLGARGKVFLTKKGEKSLLAQSIELLSKALRQPPKEWYGLKDIDARYRERYVDLLVNKESREVFLKRAKIIKKIREFLDERGYLEVETPVLQPLYGGANAAPFITRYESLNRDFYLRISDELYLKRLLVGNFERVYEIGKNFRNEGIDRTHNPEFSMIEVYEAYGDYFTMMEFTEEIFKTLAREICGGLKIKWGENEIDLGKEWGRASYADLIKKETGLDIFGFDGEELKKEAAKIGVETKGKEIWGQVADEIFKEKVEKNLIQPTFVIDWPKELSPLAKIHRADERLVERFELIIGAKEFANAFSELNDPQEQEKRFRAQMELRKKGDKEAQVMDEDFIRALEYGMPPTGGVGIGIDRLVMLLTDSQSIRDVILFPQLKEK